jgi:multiple sugar transport system ATP-binding protein
MMNILQPCAGARLEAGEGTISLALDCVPALTSGIGSRPEDLKVEAWSAASSGRPATVFEVEPLGGCTVVTVDTGREKLKALMRGQPEVRLDSAVAPSCHPAKVHFFGAAGEALTR